MTREKRLAFVAIVLAGLLLTWSVNQLYVLTAAHHPHVTSKVRWDHFGFCLCRSNFFQFVMVPPADSHVSRLSHPRRTLCRAIHESLSEFYKLPTESPPLTVYAMPHTLQMPIPVWMLL